MTWKLQCPDGQSAGLAPGEAMAAGAGPACTLQLRGAGVPAQLAEISRSGPDAWLCVLENDPPVALNGRPVRALARLLPGDRVCFGAFCVDLLGDDPCQRPAGRPLQSLALRVRGGIGSGELQHGPSLYLDGEGDLVSAAAAQVSLALAEDAIRLDPGTATVRVNGHPVRNAARLEPGDQLQVGARRFVVEALAASLPEAVTQRLGVVLPEDLDSAKPGTTVSDSGALWWLIAIAAVMAAAIAALLYFHR